MDPNLVYSRYRDDAFASQLTADNYTGFVAMPFRDRFSYRASDIYKSVIQAAADKANGILEKEPGVCGSRRFALPKRIDDQPQTARSIGDEIIKAALFAHVVIADLTFANDGVMLEVGASLAFKPTNHLVLITQGRASELHFDISGNVVIEYTPSGSIDKIADAMVAAVRDFESRRREYLTQVTRELSRDAIFTMNWYGRLRTGKFKDQNGNQVVASLHENVAISAFLDSLTEGEAPTDAQRAVASTKFQLSIRELLAKRLIECDYRPRTPEPGIDSYSYRGTRLGWMFITHMWDDLVCPNDEFIDRSAV